MMSKILFITILVAIHINYISCGELLIHICQNDNQVLNIVKVKEDKIVPIIAVRNFKENPLSDREILNSVNDCFKKVDAILVVLIDNCVETVNCLNKYRTEKDYPSLFMIDHGYLSTQTWYDFSPTAITEPYNYIVSQQTNFKRRGNTFAAELQTALKKNEFPAFSHENPPKKIRTQLEGVGQSSTTPQVPNSINTTGFTAPTTGLFAPRAPTVNPSFIQAPGQIMLRSAPQMWYPRSTSIADWARTETMRSQPLITSNNQQMQWMRSQNLQLDDSLSLNGIQNPRLVPMEVRAAVPVTLDLLTTMNKLDDRKYTAGGQFTPSNTGSSGHPVPLGSRSRSNSSSNSPPGNRQT